MTINQGPLQADPTSLAPITFAIEFSEPVTGFAESEVALSGTAGADTVQLSGAGSSYTAEVSGMDNDGTVIADIPAGVVVDMLGNGNEAATFTDHEVYFDLDEADQTPPSVTIDQAAGQTDPTSVSPVLFTAVFDEPVTGFDSASDLDLTDSTMTGTLTPTITNSGDNMTYTVSVAVTGATIDGIVEVDVVVAAAEDSATNDSLASTSTDNQVTFDVDTVPPAATINQAASQADPTSNSPVRFTATFSEPVAGFIGTDVTLTNATGGALTPRWQRRPTRWSTTSAWWSPARRRRDRSPHRSRRRRPPTLPETRTRLRRPPTTRWSSTCRLFSRCRWRSRFPATSSRTPIRTRTVRW